MQGHFEIPKSFGFSSNPVQLIIIHRQLPFGFLIQSHIPNERDFLRRQRRIFGFHMNPTGPLSAKFVRIEFDKGSFYDIVAIVNFLNTKIFAVVMKPTVLFQTVFQFTPMSRKAIY